MKPAASVSLTKLILLDISGGKLVGNRKIIAMVLGLGAVVLGCLVVFKVI